MLRRAEPSPIPRRGTVAMDGNRIRQFDLGSLEPGDVLHVKTLQSDWYFTRTKRSVVTRDQVRGIFVQTSSRAFGQITRDPANVSIDRVIEKGEQIRINGARRTGDVEQIFLNGRELT